MHAETLRGLSLLELVENRRRLQQAVYELEDMLSVLEEERDEATATREMLQSSLKHLHTLQPGVVRRAWNYVLGSTTPGAPVEVRTETTPNQSLSLSFVEEKAEIESPLNLSVGAVARPKSPRAVQADTFVLEEAVTLPLKAKKPDLPPTLPRSSKHKTLRASKSQNMPRQTVASKRKSDLN